MKIKTTLEINAPAPAVWEVLGENFADVSEWADSITKSSINGPLGNGVVRTCDLKGFGPVADGQVKEKMTHFDRESHTMTYIIVSGVPNLMKSIENAWRIEALGDSQCLVTSQAVFNFKWWALPLSLPMRIPLSRGVKEFIQQLSNQVEKTRLHI
ncbi:MAG: hypothetical protein ACI9EW_004087 [Cellvibrionaceae bacterium]|jgi:hypothetical protein